jgi:hypothetical protein
MNNDDITSPRKGLCYAEVEKNELCQNIEEIRKRARQAIENGPVTQTYSLIVNKRSILNEAGNRNRLCS